MRPAAILQQYHLASRFFYRFYGSNGHVDSRNGLYDFFAEISVAQSTTALPHLTVCRAVDFNYEYFFVASNREKLAGLIILVRV